ncbi:type II and III secretion system protein [Luteolibacter ambystomatis]|uniref:Type II and III secretion system protein n=1 Tax=Luteolibacter ambystomatis TaxID=2824561 RepID=A0A975J0C2_9BACT|nr:Amuc_1098 family type IV pilus outer membrane protein [Luteolibacter ambystomatis]QUE51676.1 type II and III secretion system protein [Luteolibacter ambystomatis]
MATACLVVPVLGADTPGLFEHEQAKRYQGVEEAQELLVKGDEAYNAGRYSDAVTAYSGARALIPKAPATIELREAATERYAQASVEYGRELLRKGDLEGAKAAVDKVLAKDVAPGDLGAVAFKNQLNDPIRNNPAMTAEHGKNVDQVRKLLYTAEGAFNLGKYDEAKATYEKVLRIDATNSAARRGMERIAAAKSGYHRSSYDSARAEMLGKVEAAWELQPLRGEEKIPGMEEGVVENSNTISVRNKIDRLILPSLVLDQVTLEEAVDYLRSQASKLDTFELDPQRKGVNFAVDLGAQGSEVADRISKKRFNLRLTNVPISGALKYINDLTQTSYTTDQFSVIIRSMGSLATEMSTRTYHVPPNFLSSITEGEDGGAAAAPPDPFGTDKPATTGLLAKRRDILDVFKSKGITFPEGATATLNAATNVLIVRNTEANQDMISQLVEVVIKTEPIQVIVTVTMLKAEEHRIDELGFDWLLNDYGMSNDFFLSGGKVGDPGMDDIAVPTGVNRKSITSGNRSGDFAVTADAIDTAIAENTQGFANISQRAPGVLGLNGFLNGSAYNGVMRGLAQKTGIDLMTCPSVVTRSGQVASVRVVREMLYPTEYEPPEIPNRVGLTGIGTNTNNEDPGDGGGIFPVTPSHPTAFQKREVGTILEVLPTVSADKRTVDLQLKPEITDFDGFVNYGTPVNSIAMDATGTAINTPITQNAILMPVFSKMAINTSSITVADGSTIVIGGLVQERTQRVEDKTPLLGTLPVVGRLFQSNVQAPVKKNVVFMVNVRLVDPSGRPINQP